jgi:arsenical pump membrane protein
VLSTAAAAPTVWLIAGLATLGVILRPFRWPEAVWALAGAALLVALGLLSPAAAWQGVLRGHDVYLFLAGMMLLAELARREGLFDWLAGFAVAAARGSARRLLALVYGVGILVTAFLSNDATAVVLTPAVYAAARAAGATPLPHLLACAFVANAASFLLPIANPANLVIFGDRMPPLGDWLRHFTLPSLLAIAATFAVLYLTQRRSLAQPIAATVPRAVLSRGGRIAGLGILATIAVLLGASAAGLPLGLPTALAGAATVLLVLAITRQSPVPVAAGVSWGVLPLVAGLFVIVQALEATGLVETLAVMLRRAEADPAAAAWAAGLIVAAATNLANNLPVGLLAGAVANAAAASPSVTGAVLVGVVLGPNLSIAGSLSTMLWLVAIRREGLDMPAIGFLKLGLLVLPPAMLLALAALIHQT